MSRTTFSGPVNSTGGFEIASVAITATAAQINVLTGVTAGTVTASKALVVDANKDLASLRNLTLTNVDAGASGTAGSVDVFPATALKGKLSISAADSAGNTTTTITNASQAAARIYTVPDAGADANFVMSEGAATINGVKTFGNGVIVDTGTKTATAVAGAATLNKLQGAITSEALTTAANAVYTLTLTNSTIAAADMVIATAENGTNTTEGLSIERIQPAAGSCVFILRNTAAGALNGTVVIKFLTIKA